MTGNTLTSMDLVRLAQQLDRDRELGWQELQSRDYAIGVSCRQKSTASVTAIAVVKIMQIMANSQNLLLSLIRKEGL